MLFFNDAVQPDAYQAAWQRLRDAHDQGQDAIAAATALIPLLIERIDALDRGLAGLGLTLARLDGARARLLDLSDKTIRIGDGRLTLDLAWSGNAFLAGRRYESALSRVDLSDAEIARTGILRLDIDRAGATVTITFLTLDGKDTRIVIPAADPANPTTQGNIPLAALRALRAQPDAPSLASLAHRAIAACDRAGAGAGFLTRLITPAARRARSDRRRFARYLAGATDPAAEIAGWTATALPRRILADSLIRRLGHDPDTAGAVQIEAMVVVAVGRVLAAGGTGS